MAIKIALMTRKDEWTTTQDAILRQFYVVANREKLMSLLPMRSWSAIRRRGWLLGMQRGFYIPPLDRLPYFNPTSMDAIWLGCAIDCEGSIILVCRNNRRSLAPVVIFTNTHAGIIMAFKNLSFPNLKVAELKRPPNKTKYDIRICGLAKVYSFLKAIRPFLLVKREQADLVLRFIEIEDERIRKRLKYGRGYSDEEMVITERIKGLNRRGI